MDSVIKEEFDFYARRVPKNRIRCGVIDGDLA